MTAVITTELCYILNTSQLFCEVYCAFTQLLSKTEPEFQAYLFISIDIYFTDSK